MNIFSNSKQMSKNVQIKTKMLIVSSNENKGLKLHPSIKAKKIGLNYHQPISTKKKVVQHTQKSPINEFSMLIMLL